jgi:hypothetical protein
MRNTLSARACGLLAAWPATACAQAGNPGLTTGIAAFAVLLQFLPLLHLGLNRRYSPCYRTTYCLVYMAVVFSGWVLAGLVWEFTHTLLWSALPMLLPYAYWAALLLRPAPAGRCETKYRD